jgi:hypothetical protein
VKKLGNDCFARSWHPTFYSGVRRAWTKYYGHRLFHWARTASDRQRPFLLGTDKFPPCADKFLPGTNMFPLDADRFY